VFSGLKWQSIFICKISLFLITYMIFIGLVFDAAVNRDRDFVFLVVNV